MGRLVMEGSEDRAVTWSHPPNAELRAHCAHCLSGLAPKHGDDHQSDWCMWFCPLTNHHGLRGPWGDTGQTPSARRLVPGGRWARLVSMNK